MEEMMKEMMKMIDTMRDEKLKVEYEIKDEEEECAVCLEEMNEKRTLVKLECGHGYHKECIKRWLSYKDNCPYCRGD